MKPIIVIALGGNALLRRGQVMSYENQLENIQIAAHTISKLSEKYRVAIVHGNGPQVGLLAQQNDSYKDVPSYPLSCLVSETQGMIGTMLIQELRKRVDIPIVSLLTHVEVDSNDTAFNDPNKFIGAVYSEKEAQTLAKQHNWTIKPDGQYFRRVVASPKPIRVRESHAIKTILDKNHIVICGGGGGIPVTKINDVFTNIDCVIDKDATAALLAEQIQADFLLILTDGDGIFLNWGTPEQVKLDKISVNELSTYQFQKGSMQPKVDAVINFVRSKKERIGLIADLKLASEALAGQAGTQITN